MAGKWIVAAVLPLMLALASCQTGPTVQVDKHTGTTGVYSSRVVAYSGLLDFLSVDAFHLTKVGYGVEAFYTGSDWIFPREVWSMGTQYPYAATSSSVGGCDPFIGCVTGESGVIRFTESQFRAAAQVGFEFRMLGAAGSIEGKVPARLFQEVLDAMGK